VTERPILMSAPMVTACMREVYQKTQTRRVLRPQPHEKLADTVHYDRATGGAMWASIRGDHGVACPYGRPGDRLWVRETYAIIEVDGTHVSIARAERMPAGKTLADTDGGLKIIQVDRETAAWAAKRVDCERWKPAIFMPRWACRLVLEVTAVRVERLQDISEIDARAEGFLELPFLTDDPAVHRDAARDWYMDLWDSLNAARGFDWKMNPWVWAVSFRRAA